MLYLTELNPTLITVIYEHLTVSGNLLNMPPEHLILTQIVLEASDK